MILALCAVGKQHSIGGSVLPELSTSELSFSSFISPLSLHIAFALIIGKVVGVTLFVYLGYWLKIADLPPKVGFGEIVGVGFLAGIGFTMSIFVSMLAFGEEALQTDAKSGIFMASLIAGLIGYLILALCARRSSLSRL